MAKIRVFKEITNDVWKAMFVNDAQELSETDKKLMRKFGEPEIQVGGLYLDGDPDEFELPELTIKIRSDLPYTAEFDSRTAPFDENTQTKVEAYIADIVDRFESAFTTLRAMPDTYTGEEVHNI
jgi:hypothetical protein